MPWQQHVADVALEVNPKTGRLAYREVVLTVPRRSGKSALIFAVLIHRMIAMGRPQVAAFTMQNGLQARMRLRREWKPTLERSPALRDVYDPSLFSGAEALMFRDGSRLEVAAGTESSGHGATLDLAVVDEAFDQPDDRLEQAFRPAIRTQPDAQLWWVSTAGKPSDLWFRGKVESARAGVAELTGTAIFEWSAADDADPADPAVWWECMPALGFVRSDGSGLTESDIAEEYRAMARGGTDDGFRRAYLNQWVSAGAGLFDAAAWSALADVRSAALDPVAVAVDVTPDRSSASVAIAGNRKDGRRHVELVDNHPGTGWVVERLAQLVRKWSPSCVVLDAAGPAGSLLPALAAENIDPLVVSTRLYGQACGAFYDAVVQGSVRHLDQPALNVAVTAARKRTLGDAWAWARRDTTDISPLVAVTLALHGLAEPSGKRPGQFLSF